MRTIIVAVGKTFGLVAVEQTAGFGYFDPVDLAPALVTKMSNCVRAFPVNGQAFVGLRRYDRSF